MDTDRRGILGFGVVLVLVGAFFLAAQFIPGLDQLIQLEYQWPWWVIGVGVVFLLLSALLRVPGLAVPGAIISGIGGILYYQNTTGDWASWSYIWALIPGFVGIGIMLMNFLEGKFMHGLREGLGAIVVSLVMFAIFGSFLGGPRIMGDLWPLLLIGAGVLILLQNLRRRPSHTDQNPG
jgi:hypothetical protein